MSKTGSITSQCWEVSRRLPDWRMRSPSVEGGDNTTLPERGPLGPVGVRSSPQSAHRGGHRVEVAAAPKTRANVHRFWWMSGSGLTREPMIGRLSVEPHGDWCLKPYWGKPTVRNFREGGWKHDQGRRTEAQRENVGIATVPYRACASALPDAQRS